MEWTEILLDRARPGSSLSLPPFGVGLAGFVALAGIAWRPAWQRLRLAVTLVHELGHAAIGVAVGRQFTGFVLRGDMSGHAVTRGRPQGLGLVATTWAGYPGPALVGAGLVVLAGQGWAAPATTVVLAALLVALAYVRSGLTFAVTGAALIATGALWWWRIDELQEIVLVSIGLVLLVGAWRHLGALLPRPGRGSDAGMLARLTHLPGLFWVATFAAACASATWLVIVQLGAALGE